MRKAIVARISVDDELFADHRFKRLEKNIGEDQALGMVMRFWRIAQHCWGDSKSLMPREEFDSLGLKPLMDVGLAVDRDNGVYARGSEERFAWYLQRCENGRKRKESVRSEDGQFKKEVDQRKHVSPDKDPAKSPAAGQTIQPPVPVPVPVPVSVPYRTDKEELKGDFSNPPLELDLGINNQIQSGNILPITLASSAPRFIAAYVKAYQDRYGPKARPDLGGKIQGQIKAFLKDCPIDRACNAIQVYCQMEKKWFMDKNHDFITFTQNLCTVYVALDTGFQPGGTDWASFCGQGAK